MHRSGGGNIPLNKWELQPSERMSHSLTVALMCHKGPRVFEYRKILRDAESGFGVFGYYSAQCADSCDGEQIPRILMLVGRQNRRLTRVRKTKEIEFEAWMLRSARGLRFASSANILQVNLLRNSI